jgi:hypothetical protein
MTPDWARSARMLGWLRRYEPLITLGVAAQLVYLIYFLRYFPLLPYYGGYRFFTDFVTSIPALIGMIAAFSGLFFLFLLAWRELRLLPEKHLLALILGFGAIFSATLLFVYPIHGLDIYKYAEAGTIFFIHHRNPMTTAPIAFPHDLFTPMTDGLKTAPSPYGPLGMLINSLPTPISSGSVLANLLLLKVLASLFVLADAYLIYLLLAPANIRLALSGALLVAWNPLILFETSVNGHNDASMALFVLLGLFLMSRGRTVLGVVSVTVSALVKYGTLPLIPLFLLYGMLREPTPWARLRYACLSIGSSLAVAAVVYSPFWVGANTFRRSIQEDQKHFYSFSATLNSLVSSISPGSASILGRLLYLAVYAAILWVAVRRRPDLGTLTCVSLFAFLLLAVDTFRAWYSLWAIIPAMAVARFTERAWAVLFSYLVTVGVLIYSYGPGPNGFVNVFPNTLPYVLTFGPAAIALSGLYLWRHNVWRMGKSRV